jgi:hypothetical protein
LHEFTCICKFTFEGPIFSFAQYFFWPNCQIKQLFPASPSINLVFGSNIEDLLPFEEEFDNVGDEYIDEDDFRPKLT